ncbi:MAG: phospholipase D-like domain-containing protein [Leptolyngbyaceae bacterium]|nr:phospholipase D-like domain-containing protein [Leptolyngbyaceae bacterium]
MGVQIWRKASSTIALKPALPQDPLIQVYFNHNQSASYTEPYRDRHRLGDDLEQIIIDAIASANVSVDVAIQEFQLPGIAHALREKQESGVPVRVILENQYSRSWSDYTAQEIQSLDDRSQGDYVEFKQFVDGDGDRHISQSELLERDALSILRAANIPTLDDTADGSKGSGLMHHKFVLIDGKQVVLGSLNFTLSGSHGDWASETSLGNANHLVAIQSSELAAIFTQEFELMWGDGPGGQTDSQFGLQKPYRPPQSVVLSPTSSLTVQFSPTSSSRYSWDESANGLISRTLNRSQQTIDLALFVFSEQPLSQVLQDRQRQRVTIRALIDAGFAYRNYSEALDLMGVALPDTQCRYDAENRPWTQPLTTVGAPQLDEGDVLHHKFGVIDRQIVITGSQNWSNAANTNNDETVVVIDNATVAAHFHQEFEHLYATAELGIPGWLQDKIQSQGDRCSSASHR